EWNYIPVATSKPRLTNPNPTPTHKRISKRRPVPPMAWTKTRTRHRKWQLESVSNYCRKTEEDKNASGPNYALIHVEVWIVQGNKRSNYCKRHKRKHPHPWRENGLNNIHHNYPITGL